MVAAHAQAVVTHVFVLIAAALIDRQLLILIVAVAAHDVNGQIEAVILPFVIDARVRVALVAVRQRGRPLHPLVHLLRRFRIID